MLGLSGNACNKICFCSVFVLFVWIASWMLCLAAIFFLYCYVVVTAGTLCVLTVILEVKCIILILESVNLFTEGPKYIYIEEISLESQS